MSRSIDNSETFKSKTKVWALNTVDSFLFIINLTIIYLTFLLADTLILFVINWSFGSVINQFPFAADLLDGIKLLSALGTAVAYAFHLIYILFQEGRHLAKVIREPSKTKEELL